MNDTKHTPTPWEVNAPAASVGSRKREVFEVKPVSERFFVLAECGLEANAAHIVKCVNAHDELVDLVRYFYSEDWRFNEPAQKLERAAAVLANVQPQAEPACSAR